MGYLLLQTIVICNATRWHIYKTLSAGKQNVSVSKDDRILAQAKLLDLMAQLEFHL